MRSFSQFVSESAVTTPMRFTYKDHLGNVRRLFVTPTKISAAVGHDGTVPGTLSNFTFMDNGNDGDAGKERRLRDALRKAYDASAGDPEKVLVALKKATKIPEWKVG